MKPRALIGRGLLAFAIAATPGFQVTADWSFGHINNPDWPPHAKYHLIVYHLTLVIFSMVALYVCWGKWRFRRFPASFSTFAVFAFWLPYYLAALFPQGSPYATPELAQRAVPAQFVVGGILAATSILGYALARGGDDDDDLAVTPSRG
jgi:hypothetical protein